MRKLDHGPAAPKIARPSIHPNPSSRFRRTSIAPPTDDSQITQHRIPTLKSDRLLVSRFRSSHDFRLLFSGFDCSEAALDGGLGGFGPFEGFGVLVCRVDVVEDGALQLLGGAMDAAPDLLSVSSPNQRSTWLLVGVKWACQRGRLRTSRGSPWSCGSRSCPCWRGPREGAVGLDEIEDAKPRPRPSSAENRPAIDPSEPSSRFRRTSIAPPTDDSQITQHRIPTLKSDRLLARLLGGRPRRAAWSSRRAPLAAWAGRPG